MTLAEMLGRISSREIESWMAYERIFGPLGQVRADLNTGILASTFANCHLREGAEPFKASDFMPCFDADKPRRKKRASMVDMMRALIGAVGGRTSHGGPGDPTGGAQ